MRLWLSVIRASVLFLALLLLISYVATPSGFIPMWTVNGREIRFPYSVKTSSPRWIEMDAVLNGKGKEFLVLPRMGLSNIEVFLNGNMIWQAGDERHHSRMWTHTFVVPIELKMGKNTVSVRSYILYDVKINWPPYFSSSPWMRVFLSNLIFSQLPIMFFGMAIVLGVLMIRISSQTSDPKGNLLFGISVIIVGTFMLDYSYIGLFMNGGFFLFVRRIYYSLSYFAVASYFCSVRRVILGKKISKKLFTSLIALSISPIVIPDFKAARMSAIISSPLMTVLSVYVLIEIISNREKAKFVAPFTFLTLSIFYSTVSVWWFPNPGILSSGVACSMLVIMEYIYGGYKDLNNIAIAAWRESLIDPLTGAFNRKIFRKIPSNMKGSLVFIDLNDFKFFNDTYGHEKGDEILKKFADVVMNRLRSDDIFIRYGGDEFIIILTGCDSKIAVRIMEEIRRNFESATGLDFSYGISDFRGNLEESIKSADRRMYEMKRNLKRRRRYDE